MKRMTEYKIATKATGFSPVLYHIYNDSDVLLKQDGHFIALNREQMVELRDLLTELLEEE